MQSAVTDVTYLLFTLRHRSELYNSLSPSRFIDYRFLLALVVAGRPLLDLRLTDSIEMPDIKPFLPSRPSGIVFIALNILRVLSILSLLLVFSANIVTISQ